MSASFAPKRLSPQLRQPSTTRAMMLDVMVALTPALGMAVFFFGLRALALTAVSVGSCVLFEALYRLLTRQRQSVGDLWTEASPACCWPSACPPAPPTGCR